VGIVIVGAGHAGWAAAEALRALDARLPLTLVTACVGDRYLKPELSIAMSRGATRETLVRETAASAAERVGLRLLPNTFVVGLSPALHQLRTTRGTLSYTHLVIAMGARPALPELLPAHLCWRINDLAAWSGLKQKLERGSKRIVIVGAGMVGCELADDFARTGHQVTLLDIQSQPLAALLPPLAAARLRAGLESAGVRFVGGVQVQGVALNLDASKRVSMCDGEVFDADEVVAATGLVTDARFASSAGLALDNGIAVNSATLQTSAQDVYALGDCVSIDGAPCRFIEPISKQASAIAHAILNRPYAGYVHTQPVIRLKTKSIPVVLHGQPVASGTWQILQDLPARLVMQQSAAGQVIASLEVG
jgi:rubredoxin-NAD+ reductase